MLQHAFSHSQIMNTVSRFHCNLNFWQPNSWSNGTVGLTGCNPHHTWVTQSKTQPFSHRLTVHTSNIWDVNNNSYAWWLDIAKLTSSIVSHWYMHIMDFWFTTNFFSVNTILINAFMAALSWWERHARLLSWLHLSNGLYPVHYFLLHIG